MTGEPAQDGSFRRYLRRVPVPAITGSHVASGKPTRRAGPPAARAPEAARQQCHPARGEPLLRATRPVSVHEVAVSMGRSRGDMSTPQKRPPTRHYLQTTSDNRRSVVWPSPIGIAAVAHLTGGFCAGLLRGVGGRRQPDGCSHPGCCLSRALASRLQCSVRGSQCDMREPPGWSRSVADHRKMRNNARSGSHRSWRYYARSHLTASSSMSAWLRAP